MSRAEDSTLSLEAALAQAGRALPSDPAAAAARIRQALGGSPGDANAQLMLGAALRAQGDAAAARAVLEPLAAAQPDSAVVQFELGMAALKLGEGRAAIGALSRAVSLDGKLAYGWKALEQQLMLAGYGRAADEVRARAIRASLPRPEFRGAVDALAEGRFEEAETVLRAHLTEHPLDVMGLYLLAEVGARVDRLAQAEDFLARVLALAPGFDRARAIYANILLRQEKGAQARPEIEQLLRSDPEDLGYRLQMAGALEQIGDYAAALPWHEDLLAQFHDHPQAWVRYGHLVRTVGRAAESVAAYHRALGQLPSLGDAYWGLANLKTYRFTDAEIGAMRDQLAGEAQSDNDRSRTQYALGKAMEDRGEFQAAVENYGAANRFMRERTPYEQAEQQVLTDRVKAVFSPAFFAARAGAGAAAGDPIFIVGLPRSGSTLIEQILSSHSAIEGTHELVELWQVANGPNVRTHEGDPMKAIDLIASVAAENLAELGEDYLRRTRAYRKSDRPLFTDKMPGNFTLAGFIHLILPNAKIVDARRHPLGCGWANFRQNFVRGQAFTFDLAEFGGYYRLYVELMAHFDAVLPGRVHRVIYERMVGDFEGEVRRLLDYCGLPFEENCLRFHENERAVRTPSSEQVRQPIYSEAVEQWRNFEPWLGPLKDALGPVLDAYPAAPAV